MRINELLYRSIFPFGTTDVSPNRIRELVDLDQAISINLTEIFLDRIHPGVSW